MENAIKKIIHFYKVYIKTDRHRINHLPIDPITQDPIERNKQVPILCYDSRHVTKPIKTQYFHIDTLDTWFQTRKEAINPLTNISFSTQQITNIIKYYKKNKKKIPKFLLKHISDNDTSSSSDKENVCDDLNIIKKIYMSSKNLKSFTDTNSFTDLLISNYDNILNDTIKLDTLFNSTYYFLNQETILMRLVLNDNLSALEEFLYFNPNLDCVDTRYNFKAIDLAIMSNKPYSNIILRTLLFHGAKTDIPTKKGYTNELTNNIEKLSILYEYIHE